MTGDLKVDTAALEAVARQLNGLSDTTTCVVGEGRLTACIQNDHGFVLQPSGSWVF